MRKLSATFFCAVLAAGALSGAALAKEAGVELGSTPSGLGPGDPWAGTLTVISPERELLRQAKPSITIRHLDTGFTRTFPAEPVSGSFPPGEAREYTFRVVFPEAGRYRYTATDGVTERVWEFLPVRIVASDAPAAAVPPTKSDPGGLGLLPLVGGLGAIGLVALGVGAYRKRPGRLREPVAE